MRNVAQLYYRANGFEKEISMHLSKKIFRQCLYNLRKQGTKAIRSTDNNREIVACRRQVLSKEQASTGVEQASTGVEQAKRIAEESALGVEEEDKIVARKIGKTKKTTEKILVKTAQKQKETGLEHAENISAMNAAGK